MPNLLDLSRYFKRKQEAAPMTGEGLLPMPPPVRIPTPSTTSPEPAPPPQQATPAPPPQPSPEPYPWTAAYNPAAFGGWGYAPQGTGMEEEYVPPTGLSRDKYVGSKFLEEERDAIEKLGGKFTGWKKLTVGYPNGRWGYVYVPEFDPDSLKAIAGTALGALPLAGGALTETMREAYEREMKGLPPRVPVHTGLPPSAERYPYAGWTSLPSEVSPELAAKRQKLLAQLYLHAKKLPGGVPLEVAKGLIKSLGFATELGLSEAVVAGLFAKLAKHGPRLAKAAKLFSTPVKKLSTLARVKRALAVTALGSPVRAGRILETYSDLVESGEKPGLGTVGKAFLTDWISALAEMGSGELVIGAAKRIARPIARLAPAKLLSTKIGQLGKYLGKTRAAKLIARMKEFARLKGRFDIADKLEKLNIGSFAEEVLEERVEDILRFVAGLDKTLQLPQGKQAAIELLTIGLMTHGPRVALHTVEGANKLYQHYKKIATKELEDILESYGAGLRGEPAPAVAGARYAGLHPNAIAQSLGAIVRVVRDVFKKRGLNDFVAKQVAIGGGFETFARKKKDDINEALKDTIIGDVAQQLSIDNAADLYDYILKGAMKDKTPDIKQIKRDLGEMTGLEVGEAFIPDDAARAVRAAIGEMRAIREHNERALKEEEPTRAKAEVRGAKTYEDALEFAKALDKAVQEAYGVELKGHLGDYGLRIGPFTVYARQGSPKADVYLGLGHYKIGSVELNPAKVINLIENYDKKLGMRKSPEETAETIIAAIQRAPRSAVLPGTDWVEVSDVVSAIREITGRKRYGTKDLAADLYKADDALAGRVGTRTATRRQTAKPQTFVLVFGKGPGGMSAIGNLCLIEPSKRATAREAPRTARAPKPTRAEDKLTREQVAEALKETERKAPQETPPAEMPTEPAPEGTVVRHEGNEYIKVGDKWHIVQGYKPLEGGRVHRQWAKRAVPDDLAQTLEQKWAEKQGARKKEGAELITPADVAAAMGEGVAQAQAPLQPPAAQPTRRRAAQKKEVGKPVELPAPETRRQRTIYAKPLKVRELETAAGEIADALGMKKSRARELVERHHREALSDTQLKGAIAGALGQPVEQVPDSAVATVRSAVTKAEEALRAVAKPTEEKAPRGKRITNAQAKRLSEMGYSVKQIGYLRPYPDVAPWLIDNDIRGAYTSVTPRGSVFITEKGKRTQIAKSGKIVAGETPPPRAEKARKPKPTSRQARDIAYGVATDLASVHRIDEEAASRLGAGLAAIINEGKEPTAEEVVQRSGITSREAAQAVVDTYKSLHDSVSKLVRRRLKKLGAEAAPSEAIEDAVRRILAARGKKLTAKSRQAIADKLGLQPRQVESLIKDAQKAEEAARKAIVADVARTAEEGSPGRAEALLQTQPKDYTDALKSVEPPASLMAWLRRKTGAAREEIERYVRALMSTPPGKDTTPDKAHRELLEALGGKEGLPDWVSGDTFLDFVGRVRAWIAEVGEAAWNAVAQRAGEIRDALGLEIDLTRHQLEAITSALLAGKYNERALDTVLRQAGIPVKKLTGAARDKVESILTAARSELNIEMERLGEVIAQREEQYARPKRAEVKRAAARPTGAAEVLTQERVTEALREADEERGELTEADVEKLTGKKVEKALEGERKKGVKKKARATEDDIKEMEETEHALPAEAEEQLEEQSEEPETLTEQAKAPAPPTTQPEVVAEERPAEQEKAAETPKATVKGLLPPPPTQEARGVGKGKQPPPPGQAKASPPPRPAYGSRVANAVKAVFGKPFWAETGEKELAKAVRNLYSGVSTVLGKLLAGRMDEKQARTTFDPKAQPRHAKVLNAILDGEPVFIPIDYVGKTFYNSQKPVKQRNAPKDLPTVLDWVDVAPYFTIRGKKNRYARVLLSGSWYVTHSHLRGVVENLADLRKARLRLSPSTGVLAIYDANGNLLGALKASKWRQDAEYASKGVYDAYWPSDVEPKPPTKGLPKLTSITVQNLEQASAAAVKRHGRNFRRLLQEIARFAKQAANALGGTVQEQRARAAIAFHNALKAADRVLRADNSAYGWVLAYNAAMEAVAETVPETADLSVFTREQLERYVFNASLAHTGTIVDVVNKMRKGLVKTLRDVVRVLSQKNLVIRARKGGEEIVIKKPINDPRMVKRFLTALLAHERGPIKGKTPQEVLKNEQNLEQKLMERFKKAIEATVRRRVEREVKKLYRAIAGFDEYTRGGVKRQLQARAREFFKHLIGRFAKSKPREATIENARDIINAFMKAYEAVTGHKPGEEQDLGNLLNDLTPDEAIALFKDIPSLDEVVNAYNVLSRTKKKAISELSLDELLDVHAAIAEAVKAMQKQELLEIAEAVGPVADAISNLPKELAPVKALVLREGAPFINRLAGKIFIGGWRTLKRGLDEALSADALFGILAEYSPSVRELRENLLQGVMDAYDEATGALRYVHAWMKRHGYTNPAKSLARLGRERVKVRTPFTFKDSTEAPHREMNLTKLQLIYLRNLFQDPVAAPRLKALLNSGEWALALPRGALLSDSATMIKVEDNPNAYNQLVDAVRAAMTPELTALADAFLDAVDAKKHSTLMEAIEAVTGVHGRVRPHYWPIKLRKKEGDRDPGRPTGAFFVDFWEWLKSAPGKRPAHLREVVGSKSPIFIADALDAVQEVWFDAARYKHARQHVENVVRVFTNPEVIQAMDSAFGIKNGQLMRRIIIEGAVLAYSNVYQALSESEKAFGRLLSRFVSSALAMPHIALIQACSAPLVVPHEEFGRETRRAMMEALVNPVAQRRIFQLVRWGIGNVNYIYRRWQTPMGALVLGVRREGTGYRRSGGMREHAFHTFDILPFGLIMYGVEQEMGVKWEDMTEEQRKEAVRKLRRVAADTQPMVDPLTLARIIRYLRDRGPFARMWVLFSSARAKMFEYLQIGWRKAARKQTPEALGDALARTAAVGASVTAAEFIRHGAKVAYGAMASAILWGIYEALIHAAGDDDERKKKLRQQRDVALKYLSGAKKWPSFWGVLTGWVPVAGPIFKAGVTRGTGASVLDDLGRAGYAVYLMLKDWLAPEEPDKVVFDKRGVPRSAQLEAWAKRIEAMSPIVSLLTKDATLGNILRRAGRALRAKWVETPEGKKASLAWLIGGPPVRQSDETLEEFAARRRAWERKVKRAGGFKALLKVAPTLEDAKELIKEYGVHYMRTFTWDDGMGNLSAAGRRYLNLKYAYERAKAE